MNCSFGSNTNKSIGETNFDSKECSSSIRRNSLVEPEHDGFNTTHSIGVTDFLEGNQSQDRQLDPFSSNIQQNSLAVDDQKVPICAKYNNHQIVEIQIER